MISVSLPVDVWPVSLKATDSVLRYFWNLLDSNERDRAMRFRFPHLTKQYVISHGVLRVLLGSYSGRDPREIVFAYSTNGKPSFSGSANLKFNVSHSAGLMIVALTPEGELGVDIEKIRRIDELEIVATSFFCKEEIAALKMLPLPLRPTAFLLCWTRKEAYVKALGDGLSIELNSFQVTLHPEEAARFIHIGHDLSVAKNWCLHHLNPAPSFVGALAYFGAPRNISVRPPLNADDLVQAFHAKRVSGFDLVVSSLGKTPSGCPASQSS